MNRPESCPVFELRDVHFRYSDGSRGLDGCSLDVERGSRTAILGVNGAGKTTLLLHLNGLLRPQSGTVCFDGKALDYGRRGMQLLRGRVGLVFQNPDAQLFSASVREDVSFGPMNLGLDRATVRARVEEALAATRLTELAGKPVHDLSHGQKKRVCIAGVLAMRPEALILDEPLAGLDVPMQRELLAILDKLHADGITVLISTHDIDFAYQWADRLHIMEAGVRAASWSAHELPGDLPRLAGFGIGVPKVAELHRLMAERGMVGGDGPMPRGHEELLGLIRDLAEKRHA